MTLFRPQILMLQIIKTNELSHILVFMFSIRVGTRKVVSTYAFIFGSSAVGEAIDRAQVFRRELVWGPQLDLCLHISQIDLRGKRTRAVVPLLGLLDEVVYDKHQSRTTER